MLEPIHTVRSVKPCSDLKLTEFSGEQGPALHFEIRDPTNGRHIVAPYAEVELLHYALGAWLLDCLVTGRVTPEQRGPRE